MIRISYVPVAILSPKEEEGIQEKNLPNCIYLMQDGGCVTSGFFPPSYYYPSWEIMSHYTGITMADYEAETPGIRILGAERTEYGPPPKPSGPPRGAWRLSVGEMLEPTGKKPA